MEGTHQQNNKKIIATKNSAIDISQRKTYK
jgi:hypothetical protein